MEAIEKTRMAFVVSPFQAFISNVRNCAYYDQTITLGIYTQQQSFILMKQRRHVKLIWRGIRDAFLFSFRCCFASCAASKLDRLTCEMQWKEEPFYEKKI